MSEILKAVIAIIVGVLLTLFTLGIEMIITYFTERARIKNAIAMEIKVAIRQSIMGHKYTDDLIKSVIKKGHVVKYPRHVIGLDSENTIYASNIQKVVKFLDKDEFEKIHKYYQYMGLAKVLLKALEKDLNYFQSLKTPLTEDDVKHLKQKVDIIENIYGKLTTKSVNSFDEIPNITIDF